MCAANYSRVWHRADDRRQDPRRVCERCASKWPDITAYYPDEQPVFEHDKKPARVQAALIEVHSQLVAHVEQIKLRRMRRTRAAAVIQAAQRRHVKWRRHTRAAMCIQAARRRSQARAQARRQRRLMQLGVIARRVLRAQAAQRVQHLWSRFKARCFARRVEAVMLPIRRSLAAVPIQRRWRCIRAQWLCARAATRTPKRRPRGRGTRTYGPKNTGR